VFIVKIRRQLFEVSSWRTNQQRHNITSWAKVITRHCPLHLQSERYLFHWKSRTTLAQYGQQNTWTDAAAT